MSATPFSPFVAAMLAIASMAQEPVPVGASPPPSFAARVAGFWRGWQQDRARLLQLLDDPAGARELAADVTARVEALGAPFAWSFCPDGAVAVPTLVLSPEGDLDRLLLLRYWQGQAPAIEGFRFCVQMPAVAPEGARVERRDGGPCCEPADFRIAVTLDEAARHLDLVLWHPQFAAVDSDERWRIALLALDLTLGEAAVEDWIGGLDLAERAPTGDVCDLTALSAKLVAVREQRGWPAPGPRDQRAITYRLQPDPDGGYPRADVIAGTSVHPGLAGGYRKARGHPEDRLAGTGACYAFVAFPSSCLDAGHQVEQRDAIARALGLAVPVARVLGGAFGTDDNCIDLLLFDAAAAESQLRRALADLARVRSARLCFFAGDRAAIALK